MAMDERSVKMRAKHGRKDEDYIDGIK